MTAECVAHIRGQELKTSAVSALHASQALEGHRDTGTQENEDCVRKEPEQEFRVQRTEEKENLSVPIPGPSTTLNLA